MTIFQVVIYKFWPVLLVSVVCSYNCKNIPVIYPERKDIIEVVYASGKITSENEYKLAALSGGTIIKKLVKDGDTVQKNQLLYVISNEGVQEKYDAALKNYNVVAANLSENSPLLNDLRLTLQNAIMKCSNDSLTYYRYKDLWAQDIGTKGNLDNMYINYQLSVNQKKIAEQKYYAALNDLQVSYSNARSQLTSAGKNLREYFIRSDRDGIVYQTFKEAGETANPNEVVALIGERSNQIIRLAVDQQDIGRIKTGQQVLLQTDVTADTVFEAVVKYIYPVMNDMDQTFRVDASFSEPPASFFIHSSVEANIVIQKKNRALVLPRNVLSGSDSIWIHTKKGRQKIAVKTGITTLDYVEIISGLNENTPVMATSKNTEP